MKKQFILAALAAMLTISASAQQVTTLYFLENAPMRHTLNPALKPVSKGYLSFTPLGWMVFGVGNNSLTMSDVLFKDPTTNRTITPLHPNADKAAFLRQIQNMTYINGEATLGLFNIGTRVREKGFFTLGINERIEAGATVPKSIFNFALGGGMTDLTGGINNISLGGLGAGATIYTEIAGGYSHRLNDKWTVGGKLKLLLGTASGVMNSKNLQIDASAEQWRIHGDMDLAIAAPIDMNYLSQYIDGKNMSEIIEAFKDGSFDPQKLGNLTKWQSYIIPSGFGAAIDFGFAWKPIEHLQVTAAITDLGFIYWTKAGKFSCSVDTVFEGAGKIDYSDPRYHENHDPSQPFSTDSLWSQVSENLMGLLGGFKMTKSGSSGFARMTSARLNIGLDANFWDNRVGVGLVSATRLYNARLYEEVTFGVSFRPVNWFNIACTYSLMNNGKYSNIGAGLSFMPYDGINMTLAMDYIPTSYAGLDKGSGQKMYVIPDKAKMFNLALGFSICWGTNQKDKDKDGVWDKLDMCPETPRGVEVDEFGCPIDEDHDGVPDYLDHCRNTLPEAIAFIDSVGCDKDSDGDGVEDYRDRCPNTPEAAWGKTNEYGCPVDTDGDGIADYMDECPGTPEAAYGRVDDKGCPFDSDGDGVPDYLDECPGTPAAAHGHVDNKGCTTDRDNDGVPDFMDECPDTPEKAIGYVDAKGCELDTDGDEVPDYKDECPTVPGLKENKGCPEVKREVRKVLEKAVEGIEFETGKAAIKKTSYPILDQVATVFIENKNYIVEVQGHTDNTGNADKNKALSQKRAEAVREYLINKGVDADRLTAVGYGQEQPIADNSTAAGRAKNRRVVFKISFEEIQYETVLEHAEQTLNENNID